MILRIIIRVKTCFGNLIRFFFIVWTNHIMHWQWSPLLKGRKWVYRRGLRWREKKNQHWDGADYLPSSPVFGWAHDWSWCKHSPLSYAVVEKVKEMLYFILVSSWPINQENKITILTHELLLFRKYIKLFDTFLNIKKFY